jgi:putative DNA methylase
MNRRYCRRLIETDLPIRKVSINARREKSVGPISTLHAWWARRPLAACRAVILAALLPDPTDETCPARFRSEAALRLRALRERRGEPRLDLEAPKALRDALLGFIAAFSDLDLAHDRDYLETSHALILAAHEIVGGGGNARPMVVDSFAGGGAIPLEALRVGADTFASDLNPVAVLLNKVTLEYVPAFGDSLLEAITQWGGWVRKQCERELSRYYLGGESGATAIAYLWCRTITCEGPGCGAEVPLVRNLRLSKQNGKAVGLRLVSDKTGKRIDVQVVQDGRRLEAGTVKRGAASCPVCGYTTAVEQVRAQLKVRKGGARDARLVCVISTRQGQPGRTYRAPIEADLKAIEEAARALEALRQMSVGALNPVPDEPLPPEGTLGFRVQKYGMLEWGDLFTARQALALSTFVKNVRRVREGMISAGEDSALAIAVTTCLALALDRLAEHSTSICRWNSSGEKMQASFGRQAVPIVWDFCEAQPFGGSVGDWDALVDCVVSACRAAKSGLIAGTAIQANASQHPLPDDFANAFVTDPPYYDAVPYADLSDFFYVWLRRTIGDLHPALFNHTLTPKSGECVVNPVERGDGEDKDSEYFERTMMEAMREGRRLTRPDGIGIVVFAHKSTSGWEAQLQAMIDAGWRITASWPIDTEMGSRLRAQNSAALASSIHLVCRPRDDHHGNVQNSAVGDWREVLDQLPKRIHEWMPRLAEEGVVGADAVFACLGPALEIFSRYSHVEKASGDSVPLKEYLEHVWGAVAKEALAMIFSGADATGFEEDARLTAMWLWTLSTGAPNSTDAGEGEDEAVSEEEEASRAVGETKMGGFLLEYDAARKIAQGLGAHLEQLASLVEVKGSNARLLPVAERTRSLFHKEETAIPAGRSKSKKKTGQLSMAFVADLEEAEEKGGWGETGAPQRGETVLDRVHQAMILFGAGRSQALKRFLVDDVVGRDDRFWRLAQALVALYPASTDEKRWVEGVLARKKGLGF